MGGGGDGGNLLYKYKECIYLKDVEHTKNTQRKQLIHCIKWVKISPESSLNVVLKVSFPCYLESIKNLANLL